MDLFSHLFLFRLREVIDVIIKMLEHKLHHLLLKFRQHSVEVVNDLLLCGLQVMCDDFLFIKDVILGRVDLLPGQDMFKDVPRTLAVDIRDRSRNFDIGALQHLLETVQLPITLTNKAFAVVDEFPEFTLAFSRYVAGLRLAVLQKVCDSIPHLSHPFSDREQFSYGGH